MKTTIIAALALLMIANGASAGVNCEGICNSQPYTAGGCVPVGQCGGDIIAGVGCPATAPQECCCTPATTTTSTTLPTNNLPEFGSSAAVLAVLVIAPAAAYLVARRK